MLRETVLGKKLTYHSFSRPSSLSFDQLRRSVDVVELVVEEEEEDAEPTLEATAVLTLEVTDPVVRTVVDVHSTGTRKPGTSLFGLRLSLTPSYFTEPIFLIV